MRTDTSKCNDSSMMSDSRFLWAYRFCLYEHERDFAQHPIWLHLACVKEPR